MKNQSGPIGTGVISILTVLLVLTLSVFAALTLASARADLALSQRSAQMVSAYYQADAQAAALYAQFAAGTEETLEQTIPMTEHQALRLRLARGADGSVEILEWRTVASEPESDGHLPVWDGTLPEDQGG